MQEIRHATVQSPARRPVFARLSQGQGVQQTDAWAFVGTNGRSKGFVPKAMIVAFWKKSRKLLGQTLVYHASEGVAQGQALSKIHKQWKGATLDPLHLTPQWCKVARSCTCFALLPHAAQSPPGCCTWFKIIDILVDNSKTSLVAFCR